MSNVNTAAVTFETTVDRITGKALTAAIMNNKVYKDKDGNERTYNDLNDEEKKTAENVAASQSSTLIGIARKAGAVAEDYTWQASGKGKGTTVIVLKDRAEAAEAIGNYILQQLLEGVDPEAPAIEDVGGTRAPKVKMTGKEAKALVSALTPELLRQLAKDNPTVSSALKALNLK